MHMYTTQSQTLAYIRRNAHILPTENKHSWPYEAQHMAAKCQEGSILFVAPSLTKAGGTDPSSDPEPLSLPSHQEVLCLHHSERTWLLQNGVTWTC